MVFSGAVLLSVANASAEVWQWMACFPERLSGAQLLDLVLCFPLEQLSRWAFCLWTFFCVPPYPDHYYYYQSSLSRSRSHDFSDSDSEPSSPGGDYHHYNYDSHSD